MTPYLLTVMEMQYHEDYHYYSYCDGILAKYKHNNQVLRVDRMESTTREKGFKAILFVTASCYVHRIAAKQGYGAINTIPCDEYVDPLTGKRIFANMGGPHDTIFVFAKRL